MESYALKPLGTISSSARGETRLRSDRDRSELAYVGKNQVLRRNFGFMSMLGFSCTLMSTWEGLLATFVFGFINGGPAGLVYGYLLTWIGTLCLVVCLAELASMAPTSAGQYHWVAILAPESCKLFLSYFTGWLTVVGWQAAVASGFLAAATIIQGLLVLNLPEYNFQLWHGTLLFLAILALALFVNTYLGKHLAKLEGIILVVHVLGLLGIMISLLYLAPAGTAKDVFATFLNEGGWDTQGLAFFVGLTGAIFAFAGADGPAHMAEEVQDASTVVPWTMLTTILLNGSLGLGMLIAVLFSLGNVQNVLSTPTGYPFIEVFAAGAGLAGGTTMTIIVVILGIFSGWSLLAAASRQMWAFARDNGLPLSRLLARVSDHIIYAHSKLQADIA